MLLMIDKLMKVHFSRLNRVIRPKIVIASGDLTTGENQFKEDWEMYQVFVLTYFYVQLYAP